MDTLDILDRVGWYVAKACTLPAGRDKDGYLMVIDARPGDLAVRVNSERFLVYIGPFPFGSGYMINGMEPTKKKEKGA